MRRQDPGRPGRLRPRANRRRAGLAAVCLLVLGGCAGASRPSPADPTSTSSSSSSSTHRTATPSPTPTVVRPYAATGAGHLLAAARRARPLVYVPDQGGGVVRVIDPSTYAVVDTFPVATSPEHVVPNHDLTRLWVNSDAGNSLTPIDPVTGRPGTPVPVEDPYNLYFTPDGKYALVMAERLRVIEVRDARTMRLVRTLPVPCGGVNHLDYTADLTSFVASCEFSGLLLQVDADATRLLRTIDLNVVRTPGATPPSQARSMGGPKAGLLAGASAMPQDVRLSPDGSSLLAADMLRNGVWVVDAHTMKVRRFVPTGMGAHGIYPSRDASRLYVSNRDEGSISVLDAGTLREVARWRIPGGGSPDMGGVTADGHELWMSGRYDSVVYVFDTRTGVVTHTIPVGPGPHGLLVWPQPGRMSLGHTGNMR